MTIARRPLGSTGLSVSCLGLGTVKLGRNEGVKYPSAFELPDDDAVRDLLACAADLGINFLDTAPAYGSSEERLGGLLERRQDWIIASKVGEQFQNGQSRFDFSARGTRQSVERSLTRLRTDYLDIVLIHSDGRDLEILETSDCLPTLRDLQEEGKIRALGMSTKTVAGGKRAAEMTDVVMVSYNAEHREEAEVIDVAAAAGKGVLIKKALNSGHLAGDGWDSTADRLRFALDREGVSSVIVGTINPGHLRANVLATRN